MSSNYQQYDWNQQQNNQYVGGDTSLHSVHGQVHAGPHSIPAHSDGAFVSAGTAGQDGFDVRSLGLSEDELKATGLHPSFHNTGHQLPLDQYKINYDPNPIIIRKQMPMEMPQYKQQVIVRYLRPPTPPSPGPLIIKEVREPQPAVAPPLVIRTRAQREKTPPPIVIREAPPQAPQVNTNPQYVTRVIRQNESSYSSPPQPQQQQYQQYQQYESFGTGPVNYDQFNGFHAGNQYTSGINQFGNQQQQPAWVTEVLSDNGAPSAAPPHLLDHIYRAVNNQLPRV